MKKIFTLLIFAGILSSAAFAQDGRGGSYGNQENSYQRGSYSQNNQQYARGGRDNGGYNENRQWNDRRGENDYGYSDNRSYGRRESWHRDRHDEWNREENEGYVNYYPVQRQVVLSNDDCNNRSGISFQIRLGR